MGLHIVSGENSIAIYTWNQDKRGFIQWFSPDLWLVTVMQMFCGPSFEIPHKAKENCLGGRLQRDRNVTAFASMLQLLTQVA